MSKPFDPTSVSYGTRLVLARDERIGLFFKFLGHGGSVVASWEHLLPGKPLDLICPQRDVRIPDPEAK